MDKQKQHRPNIETLSAAVQPETLDAERRTVDVVFFTGIDVPRANFATGEMYLLRFDPEGADLSVLNSGAPVLDDHNTFSGVSGQLGVVDRAWTDGTRYMATLRFSKRPEVDGLWKDIEDKIVSKFSMGTELVEKKDITPRESKQRLMLASKWRPYEISVAPLAADMNTTTLNNVGVDEGTNKYLSIGADDATEELKPQMENINTQDGNDEIVSPEVERMKGRAESAEILSRCSAARLPMEFATTLIAEGSTVEQASKAIFAELAKRDTATETRSQVQITRDEGDTRREQMTSALLNRVNPSQFKLEGTNDYRHMSLLRMAEECLSATGQRVRGLPPSEVARLALHSTSDFPNILAAGANKTLLQAYEVANPTYKKWAKAATMRDFKSVSRVRLGEFPQLQLVAEGGEIHSGTMAETKESYALSSYARIFGLTRQSIINDDLGAFTSFAGPIGAQVSILENRTVYSVLTGNANMSDGIALFHASHSNLAGSGGAISVSTLDAGTAAMSNQTGVDGVSKLNVVPRFLIVPVAKRTTALQYTNVPNIVYTKSSDFNPFAGVLDVIADAELDGNSTTAWYLAADTSMGCVEYATLEGNSGPQISSRVGFEVDGVEIKVVHDFAAKSIDWRGLYKNAGA